jgi:ATP:cob(I)alamin adenosyltransferase
MSCLTPEIEELHKQACDEKEDFYIDPATGLTVFTAFSHKKRGRCCGSMCRHCPFDWVNVSREKPVYTSSDDESEEEDNEQEKSTVHIHTLDKSSEKTLNSPPPTTSIDTSAVTATTSSNSTSISSTNGANRIINQPTTLQTSSRKEKDRKKAEDRKSPVYTKTGDSGTSQLFNGERRRKDDELFEALGSVDELCSFVGAARVLCTQTVKKEEWIEDLAQELALIQSQLLDLGSHVATPRASKSTTQQQLQRTMFPRSRVRQLEAKIDDLVSKLPDLNSFVLPGGSERSAALHVCRSVTRRLERALVPLSETLPETGGASISSSARTYVNRLSDYFFVLGRWACVMDGEEEQFYVRTIVEGGDEDEAEDGEGDVDVANLTSTAAPDRVQENREKEGRNHRGEGSDGGSSEQAIALAPSVSASSLHQPGSFFSLPGFTTLLTMRTTRTAVKSASTGEGDRRGESTKDDDTEYEYQIQLQLPAAKALAMGAFVATALAVAAAVLPRRRVQ